jgi:hypothetical protein
LTYAHQRNEQFMFIKLLLKRVVNVAVQCRVAQCFQPATPIREK